MREILFRGKRIDTGEWVKGFFYSVTRGAYFNPIENTCEIMTFKKLDNGEIILTEVYDVTPSTIGQFTGLTDKNGKRVFEGDIVRHGYSNQNGSFFDNGTIAFVINDGAFEIVGEKPYTKRLTRKMIVERNIETIGNIHDNPELLP